MNFTIAEEERMMEMLRSPRKEEVVMELSKEIERKEKVMRENISSDYLGIINKCADLERIKQRLPEMMRANDEMNTSISDAIVQYIGVLREMEENSLVESRLYQVLSELKEILSFINVASYYESADKDAREDPLYYYNMAKSILFMERKLCFFRKYTFFVGANQIFTRSRKSLMELMVKDVDMWIQKACNDARLVGIEIDDRLNGVSKKSCIFDTFGSLRHRFITKRFLCILHVSRRLSVDSIIIERINSRRREFVEEVLGMDDPAIISDIAGFILWSHYLVALDGSFKTHNKPVFDLLSRNEMLFRADNFSRLRAPLISLRTLVVNLNCDYEELDRIVSSVAINYFENQGLVDVGLDECDLDLVKSSMVRFIDECNEFVSNVFQFSNELDELLAKRMDSYLCHLIERNRDDVHLFIKAQSVVRSILRYSVERNSFYRGLEFRCLSELERVNRSFMETLVGQNESKIDELFKRIAEDDDFGVELLSLFSSVRELEFPDDVSSVLRRKLVLHVGDRFVSAMNDETLPLSEKRVVKGHVCSFYGYVRNNEPSLQDLLVPAVELCKRI